MADKIRLSPSLAKILLQKGPAAAYAAATNKDYGPRTPSTRLGTVVDKLIFDVGPEVVVVNSRRGKNETRDTVLVTAKELERAQAMATAVSANIPWLSAPAQMATDGAETQRKLVWYDNGMELVSKPDYLDSRHELVADLKTARDLSDAGIEHAIKTFGYDIQMAAYTEAVMAVMGWTNPRFSFVFVKSTAPFQVRSYAPNAIMVERSRRMWLQAKQIWRASIETGQWPERQFNKYGSLTEWYNT